MTKQAKEIVFNEDQKRAIEFTQGAAGVIAAAGSGKTAILLERINNLINKHKVFEHNILLISFTNNVSNELKSELAKRDLHHVNVGTFHAICGQILRKEGVNINNMIQEWQIENCFKAINPMVDVKDVVNYIGYQRSYMRGVNDDFVEKNSAYTITELRIFYKAYETLKRKLRAYDFDDYLLLCLDILRENPGKYTYDYILVDEHQDSNLVQNMLLQEWCKSGNIFTVSDYRQCFPAETKIRTSEGLKQISNLKQGDEIIVANGRGGAISKTISETIKKPYKGKLIELKTESGKIMQATPDHTVFLDTFIAEEKFFVYLMYREGMGFRIGRSSQLRVKDTNEKNGGRWNGYEKRLTDERADKIWLIKVCDTIEEVVFFENYYSNEYGIPSYVFKHNYTSGMMSQESIDTLYDSIDTKTRGLKLLGDLILHFDAPHHVPQGGAMIVGGKQRKHINFVMFGTGRFSVGKTQPYVGYPHAVYFHTIDEEFAETAKKKWNQEGVRKTVNGRGFEYYEGRKTTGNQDELLDLAYKVQDELKDVRINKSAMLTKNTKQKFHFMPLSNARVGMSVPIHSNGEIVSDTITEIKISDYNGLVYDLNIDYYRNYIAEDIVVHNCIYAFRAGNPEYSMHMDKYWKGAQTLNVHTNYRSPKNVVEKANHFIRQYYGNYEHYTDATAHNQSDGHIEVNSYSDRMVEGKKTADKIERLIADGTPLNEIAVIYRANAHADYVESELKRRNIDYEIASNGSFFKRREIAGILSILRLVMDEDDNSAFEGAFRLRTYPLMYFSNAMLHDIQKYARDNDVTMFDAVMRTPYPKAWHRSNAQIFRGNINKLQALYDDGSTVEKLIDEIVKMFRIKKLISEKYSNEDERKEREGSIKVLKNIVQDNNLEDFIAYVYTNDNIGKKKEKENAVRMMSVHRSKGLEWDNVFVIGVEDEKFPDIKSSLDEEARVFYVATTRSKQNLYISEIGRGNKFIQEYGEV